MCWDQDRVFLLLAGQAVFTGTSLDQLSGFLVSGQADGFHGRTFRRVTCRRITGSRRRGEGHGARIGINGRKTRQKCRSARRRYRGGIAAVRRTAGGGVDGARVAGPNGSGAQGRGCPFARQGLGEWGAGFRGRRPGGTLQPRKPTFTAPTFRD